MSHIKLNNICKSYQGSGLAVSDFNLDIDGKEFIVFVGPSGCGKSTVLRMIAGLEDITSGELWMDGKLMNYESPGARNVSMVFQNYALYPHMSIYDNLAFSLVIRKIPKKEIKNAVMETAKMLGIDNLLDRKPAQLSGGQRQRVAIGSAILRKPNAFLMDEPLSNLDAKMRTQMRSEIASLYNRFDTTFIYVTHDQTEAMTLGTRIVVLKEGVIQQIELAGGEVIGCAPIRVDLLQLCRRQRRFFRNTGAAARICGELNRRCFLFCRHRRTSFNYILILVYPLFDTCQR